jgi:hypothetical protein
VSRPYLEDYFDTGSVLPQFFCDTPEGLSCGRTFGVICNQIAIFGVSQKLCVSFVEIIVHSQLSAAELLGRERNWSLNHRWMPMDRSVMATTISDLGNQV